MSDSKSAAWTYLSGPLERRHPRLGNAYQALIPDFIGQGDVSDRRKTRDERCVWSPHGIDSAALSAYLSFCRKLFETDDEDVKSSAMEKSDFDEERGLYFLMQMKYDTAAAMAMLKPLPYEKVESEAAAEEAKANEEGDGDDFCLICGDGGQLILCDFPDCNKGFHYVCVDLLETPPGKWYCPRHTCKICHESLSANNPWACMHCPVAFCDKCVPDSLRKRTVDFDDHLNEFLCQDCYAKAKLRFGPNKKVLKEKAFMKRLLVLLKSSAVPLDHVPLVNGQELNLYELYKEVTRLGGFVALDDDSWKQIGSSFGFQGDVKTALRQHYATYLSLYERKYFRSKPAGSLDANTTSATHDEEMVDVDDEPSNTKKRRVETEPAASDPMQT